MRSLQKLKVDASCTVIFVLCCGLILILYNYQNFIRFQPPIIVLRNSSYISTQMQETSLVSRNGQRWRHLQRKFHFERDSLFQFLIRGYRNSTTNVIYKCKSYCGGLGDRLRGITTSYIIALLSGRNFIIDMTHPCEMAKILKPHLYDWTLRLPHHDKNRSKMVINAIDNMAEMIPLFMGSNFVKKWLPFDDIEIFTNLNLVATVFMNPSLQDNELVQMVSSVMSPNEVHLNSFFPIIFEILFQPTVEILKVIDPVLSMITNSRKPVICLHIRVGKNPTNPNDADFSDRKNIIDDMISFISNYTMNMRNRTWIMAMSDSQTAVDTVLRKFPNNSFTAPGPILHIDRPTTFVDHCEGFSKVVIDFYLLGECDALILSNSGFSGLANRRRQNPYKNLYTYDEKMRKILICDNILSTSNWEPLQSNNMNVYCPTQSNVCLNESRTKRTNFLF